MKAVAFLSASVLLWGLIPNLAMAMSNPREAAVSYGQMALTPKDYIDLATKKKQRGDYQGALADYDMAIILAPNYAYAYSARGYLKGYMLNDIQGALSDYDVVTILNPKDITAYFFRADLKKDKLNDYQGALAEYNMAIILEPNYTAVYFQRARLKYEKLNDRLGGIADMRQAAKQARANEFGYGLLQDALKKLEEWGVRE